MGHSFLNDILNTFRPDIEKGLQDQLARALSGHSDSLILSVSGSLFRGVTKGIDGVVSAAVQHLDGEAEAKFFAGFEATAKAQGEQLVAAMTGYVLAQHAVEIGKKNGAAVEEIARLRAARSVQQDAFHAAFVNFFLAMTAGHHE